MPHVVALVAGYAENAFASLLGREPRIPLEGVRMARHKMFVDCSKAVRELGFKPAGIDGAVDRAVRWYMENGYVEKNSHPLPLGEGGVRASVFATTSTLTRRALRGGPSKRERQ
jgi:hypothetical protein